MATTTFDTLKFANTLKAAGVPDKQAEAQASVLGEALAVNFKELATKDDLAVVKRDLAAVKEDLMAAVSSSRAELQHDLRQTEQRLDAKIDGVEQRLDAKIDGVEQRLNAKIDNQSAKYDGQFTLLKWMFSLTISLIVTVLIRLFFWHGP